MEESIESVSYRTLYSVVDETVKSSKHKRKLTKIEQFARILKKLWKLFNREAKNENRSDSSSASSTPQKKKRHSPKVYSRYLQGNANKVKRRSSLRSNISSFFGKNSSSGSLNSTSTSITVFAAPCKKVCRFNNGLSLREEKPGAVKDNDTSDIPEQAIETSPRKAHSATSKLVPSKKHFRIPKKLMSMCNDFVSTNPDVGFDPALEKVFLKWVEETFGNINGLAQFKAATNALPSPVKDEETVGDRSTSKNNIAAVQTGKMDGEALAFIEDLNILFSESTTEICEPPVQIEKICNDNVEAESAPVPVDRPRLSSEVGSKKDLLGAVGYTAPSIACSEIIALIDDYQEDREDQGKCVEVVPSQGGQNRSMSIGFQKRSHFALDELNPKRNSLPAHSRFIKINIDRRFSNMSLVEYPDIKNKCTVRPVKPLTLVEDSISNKGRRSSKPYKSILMPDPNKEYVGVGCIRKKYILRPPTPNAVEKDFPSHKKQPVNPFETFPEELPIPTLKKDFRRHTIIPTPPKPEASLGPKRARVSRDSLPPLRVNPFKHSATKYCRRIQTSNGSRRFSISMKAVRENTPIKTTLTYEHKKLTLPRASLLSKRPAGKLVISKKRIKPTIQGDYIVILGPGPNDTEFLPLTSAPLFPPPSFSALKPQKLVISKKRIVKEFPGGFFVSSASEVEQTLSDSSSPPRNSTSRKSVEQKKEKGPVVEKAHLKASLSTSPTSSSSQEMLEPKKPKYRKVEKVYLKSFLSTFSAPSSSEELVEPKGKKYTKVEGSNLKSVAPPPPSPPSPPLPPAPSISHMIKPKRKKHVKVEVSNLKSIPAPPAPHSPPQASDDQKENKELNGGFRIEPGSAEETASNPSTSGSTSPQGSAPTPLSSSPPAPYASSAPRGTIDPGIEEATTTYGISDRTCDDGNPAAYSKFWVKCPDWTVAIDVHYVDEIRLRQLHDIFNICSAGSERSFGIDHALFVPNCDIINANRTHSVSKTQRTSHYWFRSGGMTVPFTGRYMPGPKVQRLFNFIYSSITHCSELRFGLDKMEFSVIKP